VIERDFFSDAFSFVFLSLFLIMLACLIAFLCPGMNFFFCFGFLFNIDRVLVALADPEIDLSKIIVIYSLFVAPLFIIYYIRIIITFIFYLISFTNDFKSNDA
jgi:hypothetical protein